MPPADPRQQFEPQHRAACLRLVAALAALLTLGACNSLRRPATLATTLPDSIPRLFGPDYEAELSGLLHAEILPGNHITTLNNGDQIFPAMLRAIRGARSSIDFCTYIYWSGEVAEQFADALSERARAGVSTRVLLDWAGCLKMPAHLLDSMREAGVEIVHYNPLRWYNPFRANYRTHRKILVVDHRVAFTGGVGIGTEWEGNARTPQEWRDMHFEIRGPAVAQLYTAFAENWNESVPADDAIPIFIDSPPRAGPHTAQAFSSSPSEGSEDIYLMIHSAIAGAKKSIRIVTPYFVVDKATEDALVAAARRGVRIVVILPGPNIDYTIVRAASRATWGRLLEAGIELYEFQPTMLHSKLMIVDDNFVSVGSANLDNRSFRLNDKTNLNVFGTRFARSQVKIFEQDRRKSERITLEAWRRRPVSEKLFEALASFGRSQY